MIDAPFEDQLEEAAEKASGILRSRFGLWALGGISFAESALPVPFITDPFLVAYILADRKAAWRGLMVTVMTSVLGGIFAYALAFLFYDFIAARYLTGHLAEEFAWIAGEFDKGTFVITMIGAVTPVPYTLVAMGAGFMKASIPIFILSSIIGRFIRYAIVAWLTYVYGQQALDMAKRHILWASAVCFALAFIYFFYFLH